MLLHGRNIAGQTELSQFILQFIGYNIAVFLAVFLVEFTGQNQHVLPVITVLRYLAVSMSADFQIPCRNAQRKTLYLIAGIIDVKLTGNLMPRSAQAGRQTVTDHTATGVTDVHRSGRVGRNELYHYLLRILGLGPAVILSQRKNAIKSNARQLVRQEEIHKAGPRNLTTGEGRAVKGNTVGNRRRRHTGRYTESACPYHGNIGRQIAVRSVLGRFNGKGGQFALRQSPIGHGRKGGFGDAIPQGIGNIFFRIIGYHV